MRVTNNMLINNLKKNLNMGLGRMQRVHNQMSSGKRFSVPSDDPVGVARSLKLRADLNENEKFQKNAGDALSWLETTESALDAIKDVLHRVKELAVQGANGTYSEEDTQAIAEEIQQLRDHLIGVGNSTYVGKHIFAGYKTNLAPVQLNGDGSLDYQGDAGTINYQVGVSDLIEASLTAEEVFLNVNNEDLLKDMQDMYDFMNTGNHQGMAGLVGNFERHLENILNRTAEVGAKSNRMELVVNRLKDENLNFTNLLSNTEDVDMADVLIRLTSEENVYRASLASGARIIQPTLIDFLR